MHSIYSSLPRTAAISAFAVSIKDQALTYGGKVLSQLSTKVVSAWSLTLPQISQAGSKATHFFYQRTRGIIITLAAATGTTVALNRLWERAYPSKPYAPTSPTSTTSNHTASAAEGQPVTETALHNAVRVLREEFLPIQTKIAELEGLLLSVNSALNELRTQGGESATQIQSLQASVDDLIRRRSPNAPTPLSMPETLLTPREAPPSEAGGAASPDQQVVTTDTTPQRHHSRRGGRPQKNSNAASAATAPTL